MYKLNKTQQGIHLKIENQFSVLGIQDVEHAGKETSISERGEQKSSSQTQVLSRKSESEYITQHVKHFVTCLSDAYGFRDPMEVVVKVSKRLEKLFAIPIEKVFKWFYGNALGWASNNLKDVSRLPEVDQLNLDSSNCYSACKIFGGRLMKFLHKLFRRLSRQTDSKSSWNRRKAAFSKAQTFLMMKKGSPQVSKVLIEEADQKHKSALNSNKGRSHKRQSKEKLKAYLISNPITDNDLNNPPKPIDDWGDYNSETDGIISEDLIKSTVLRIVDMLFPPNSFSKIIRGETVPFPSSSAHSDSQSGRQYGGAVNIIKEYFHPYHTQNLIKMTFHPRVGVRTHYEIIYKNAAKNIVAELLEDDFVAEPVYLQEPLKVRTITKGPAVPYWFFKPIQKFLWNQLKSNVLFELIGTPVTSQLLDSMLPFCIDGGKWLSGDYSAATDNLAGWLSEFIWKSIAIRAGIPDEIVDLGIKGLTGHKIHYDDGTILSQRNGQLMGSPLSFPILCIANAAICALSFSEDRSKNLRDLPLRINGDDCVMNYTEPEKKRWEFYANFIGMSPSPGKCYYAEDWLQINSELFILRKGSFRQIPFMNFSLASPFLAKGGKERPIESVSETMYSFCHGRSSKYVDIYLRRMGPYLKQKVPFLLSWYLPKCLGGLGLMTNKISGEIFTPKQLQVATLFFENATRKLPFQEIDYFAQLGAVGNDLPLTKPREVSYLPPYVVSSTKGGKAEYQKLSCLRKYVSRVPILNESKGMEDINFKFFKQKEREEVITPLLWENLVTSIGCNKYNDLFVNELQTKEVVDYKIKRLFNKKCTKVNPRALSELLTLKGVEIITPKTALISDYEPTKIYRDTLALLSNRSMELYTFDLANEKKFEYFLQKQNRDSLFDYHCPADTASSLFC
jgi:hypothetical protein